METIIIKKGDEVQIRISESEYKGKVYFHIREYYKDEDGTFSPTKKGVAMNEEVWQEFLEAVKGIK